MQIVWTHEKNYCSYTCGMESAVCWQNKKETSYRGENIIQLQKTVINFFSKIYLCQTLTFFTSECHYYIKYTTFNLLNIIYSYNSLKVKFFLILINWFDVFSFLFFISQTFNLYYRFKSWLLFYFHHTFYFHLSCYFI